MTKQKIFCSQVFETIMTINVKTLFITKELCTLLENPEMLVKQKPVFCSSLTSFIDKFYLNCCTVKTETRDLLPKQVQLQIHEDESKGGINMLNKVQFMLKKKALNVIGAI